MDRKYHTISAKGISLGRIASEAAKLLMGKNKPDFENYRDTGDFVTVTDFSAVRITGNKLEQKMYYRPTTHVGALKSENMKTLLARRPHEVLRKAIYGMLPKNTLRRSMIKRLTIKDE